MQGRKYLVHMGHEKSKRSLSFEDVELGAVRRATIAARRFGSTRSSRQITGEGVVRKLNKNTMQEPRAIASSNVGQPELLLAEPIVDG